MEDKQMRPWPEVAQALMNESVPERIIELSQELTVALEHAKDEVASIRLQSKLAS